MDKPSKTLADRARQAVDSTGLNQAEFANEAGIKLRTLQEILGGRSTNPEMSTLQGISERSGMSLDELVFGLSLAREPSSDLSSGITSADLAKSEQRIIEALRSPAAPYISNPSLQKMSVSWISAGPLLQSVALYLITKSPDDRERIHEELRNEVDQLAEHIRVLRSL